MHHFLRRHRLTRTLFLVGTIFLYLLFMIMQDMRFLWCGLALSSGYVFVLGVRDKLAAKQHRLRIPEASLWLMSVVGGAVGFLLAMLLFRHKTKHVSFCVGIPLLVIVQLALLYWII